MFFQDNKQPQQSYGLQEVVEFLLKIRSFSFLGGEGGAACIWFYYLKSTITAGTQV